MFLKHKMVLLFLLARLAQQDFVLSHPVAHISPISTNNLNWPGSYKQYTSDTPNCFIPQHTTSAFLQTITTIEQRELLKQFQYQGCKGIPLATEDQFRMLRCCDDLIIETGLELKTPTFGLYEQECSNLNILSLTQRICQEFKKNEPKYHSDFKDLFSSKDFKVTLGRISYAEFHKAMVAMILQHLLLIVSSVEQELGWNLMKDDEGRGGLDRISECFL